MRGSAVLDFDVTCSAAVEKKDRSDMIKVKLVFSLTSRWNKKVNTFYIMSAFSLHTYYNPLICWTLSSTLNETASVSLC